VILPPLVFPAITYKLIVAEDAVPPHEGVVLDALPAHGEPVRRGEVDGLRQVVAVVESGVIGPRESYHELPGVLVSTLENFFSFVTDNSENIS
jgi:hypothetical protein